MGGWEIAGERKTKGPSVGVEENRGVVKKRMNSEGRAGQYAQAFFCWSLQFTMLQEEKGGELRQEALR